MGLAVTDKYWRESFNFVGIENDLILRKQVLLLTKVVRVKARNRSVESGLQIITSHGPGKNLV